MLLTELLTEYFAKDDPEFNADEHIAFRYEDEDMILNNICVRNILPETEIIAEKNVYNVALCASDCYFERKCLYKHKKYYIVLKFAIDGYDDSILSIKDNFDTIENFYEKSVRVIHHDDFDYKDFLGPNESDLNFLMTFFINFYDGKGTRLFNLYIDNLYSKLSDKLLDIHDPIVAKDPSEPPTEN